MNKRMHWNRPNGGILKTFEILREVKTSIGLEVELLEHAMSILPDSRKKL